MIKKALLLASLATSGLAFAQGKPLFPIDCPTDKNFKTIISNQTTPDYVYADMVACVRKQTPEAHRMAFSLYGLAGSMVAYDKQRVTDTSAHAVGGALVFMFMQHEDIAAVMKNLPSVLDNPQEKQKECQKLKKMAPPAYTPIYMLNHGMAAFTGDPMKGFVPAKTPKKTWHEAVDSYLKC